MQTLPLTPNATSVEFGASSRRTQHGSIAWSNDSNRHELYQPQDGATQTRSRIADITERLTRSFREPEDARLTGGTRSLMRRVMGLNLVHRNDLYKDGARIARVA